MRNLEKPTRYSVADVHTQAVLGGDVLVVDTAGSLVEFRSYERLLSEFVTLRSASFTTAVASEDYEKAVAEVARLKAEVDILGDTLMHAETERDAFKSEVERLRKAGDAMADLLSCAGSPPNVVQSWNAAKKGGQS